MSLFIESSRIPVSFGFLHPKTSTLATQTGMDYASLKNITSQTYLHSHEIGSITYESSPIEAIPLQLEHLQEKYKYTSEELAARVRDARVATIKLEDVPEINLKYDKAAGTERILLEYKSIIDSSKREGDNDLPPYEVLIARLDRGNHLLAIFIPIRDAYLDSRDINRKINEARDINLAKLTQASPLYLAKDTLKTPQRYKIQELKHLWLPISIQRKGDILKFVSEQAAEPSFGELVHINAADALLSLLNSHTLPSEKELSTFAGRKEALLDVIQIIGLPEILKLLTSISNKPETLLSSAIVLKMLDELLLIPELSRRRQILRPRYFKESLHTQKNIIMISQKEIQNTASSASRAVGDMLALLEKTFKRSEPIPRHMTSIGGSLYIACNDATAGNVMDQFPRKKHAISSIENNGNHYPGNLVVLDQLREKHSREMRLNS